MCPVQSIFYHFIHRDESQIDYFVESVGRVEKYITFQRESLNTSSHDPIMIVINRKLCMNQNYGGKVHTHRIKWNKDDLNEYEKFVETEMKLNLKQVETLTVSNVNLFVGSICDTLVSIAENLQPKRKSNAKRKCKYMWTPEMSNLASQAKHYYYLLIDCSRFHFLSLNQQHRIEKIAAGLCFNLHQKRASLLL
jgi:hypothetical protein